LPARAQTPEPSGIVGDGVLKLDAVNPQGKPLSAETQARFETRDGLTRIDVPSLTLNINGAALHLVTDGGITVLIDMKKQRYAVWSNANHTFAWGELPKPPNPLARPEASPSPEPLPSGVPHRNKSVLAGLKNLKVFSMGLDMTGHGTTNGHPTTGFAYHFRSETNDGKGIALTGEMQSADDFGGVPIVLTAQLKTLTGGNGSLRMEITSLKRANPPGYDFLVPSGYKAVASPLQVVMPAGMGK
jgi:hypothetical protein